MSDPFEKHEIKHLSWSSMNLYRQEPALWVLRYLYRIRDEVGPAAWRGKAVEAGLDWWLYRRDDVKGAETKALDAFELEAQGEVDDKIVSENANVSLCLQQAMEAYKDTPTPTARQLRIESWFDGIEVPIIGYVDYVWEDSIHDLKTTLRMPSEPKGDHARQVALYCKETKRDGFLTYVTPKKHNTYPVENTEELLRDVARLAHAVRTTLAICPDKETAAAMFTPNPDSFYWSNIGQAVEQARAEIWS